MINKLNDIVWCKLGASSIDGVGVFAIRDIPKGQKLYCEGREDITLIQSDNLEQLLPEIKEIILQRWPLAEKGDYFFNPNDDARLLSFINHSNDPNYNVDNDTALKDIKKGEEITEYYGYGKFK
jgi:SET domain-containing protein|tara:strand:- start:11183 stop:11554 length:372 start_codon:yes stop_codon:yes gene_type:complete